MDPKKNLNDVLAKAHDLREAGPVVSKCINCGAEVIGNESLCDICIAELKWNHEHIKEIPKSVI